MTCKTVEIAYQTADGAIGRDDRIATMLAVKNGRLLAGRGAEEFKYDLEKNGIFGTHSKMELERIWETSIQKVAGLILNHQKMLRSFFKYLKKQIEKSVQASRYEYAVTIWLCLRLTSGKIGLKFLKQWYNISSRLSLMNRMRHSLVMSLRTSFPVNQ